MVEDLLQHRGHERLHHGLKRRVVVEHDRLEHRARASLEGEGLEQSLPATKDAVHARDPDLGLVGHGLQRHASEPRRRGQDADRVEAALARPSQLDHPLDPRVAQRLLDLLTAPKSPVERGTRDVGLASQPGHGPGLPRAGEDTRRVEQRSGRVLSHGTL